MRHEPFEKNAFVGMAASMLLAIFIALGGIPALVLAQGIDGAPATGADDLHGRLPAAAAGGIAKAAGVDGSARMVALDAEEAAETDAQDGEGADGLDEAHEVTGELGAGLPGDQPIGDGRQVPQEGGSEESAEDDPTGGVVGEGDEDGGEAERSLEGAIGTSGLGAGHEGGTAEAGQDQHAMSTFSAEDGSTVVGTLQAVGPYGTNTNEVGVEIDGKWYPSSDDLDLSYVARLVVGGAAPAVEATLTGGKVSWVTRMTQRNSFKASAASAKRASTTAGVAASKAQGLLGNSSLALDANLQYYFSPAQIKEMRDYLTVWSSLIIIASRPKLNNLDQKMLEKALGKLGVPYGVLLFGWNISATTSVVAETMGGAEATVEFELKMGGYAFGNGDPYTASGSISYEVKNVPSGEAVGMPRSGYGPVAFTDMKAFCDQVTAIAEGAIKTAYNEVWGNDLNKAAALFVSEPINSIIMSKYGGTYSGNLYKLATKAERKYIKEMRVKCPVDVYMYDSSDDLVGLVADGSVDASHDDVLCYLLGDEKRVFLEGDSYTVRLVGTGDGTMEVEILEYFDDSLARTVRTVDVPLAAGKEYYFQVPDAEYVDNAAYVLVDGEGNSVPLDSDSY